jgi:hypothetical protein
MTPSVISIHCGHLSLRTRPPEETSFGTFGPFKIQEYTPKVQHHHPTTRKISSVCKNSDSNCLLVLFQRINVNNTIQALTVDPKLFSVTAFLGDVDPNIMSSGQMWHFAAPVVYEEAPLFGNAGFVNED